MAESESVILSSDSEPEGAPKKPLPKRRRILTTSVAIPVYSTQVQNGLRLLKNPTKLPDKIKARCNNKLAFSSDEDDDDEEEKRIPLKLLKSRPRTYDQDQDNLSNSLLVAKKTLQEQMCDEDDVIMVDASEPRELLLKVRCRADIYKVCILMTEPLRRVINHMSQILKVDPKRLVLLHHDRHLMPESTPAKSDLSIASIIDCIVENDNQPADDSGGLLLRVQGKDRSSVMEITVQKGEPFTALMNRYKQTQGLGKLVFSFDGKPLAETQTPEQVGMESGDVIEVSK
ncbi:NFATC2-interacting protein [Ahaetulla prasina]|uniref:NFATC2-interacting protein n=1 Tax=Ahaetulla prasina TaxID=499056 RepID=UPI0026489DDA|nr:NFATC2-interacting protein [Ahaetulla prasina]